MGQRTSALISSYQRYSALISILFFFSGFSALVYEVTWARKLTLIFGTDAYGVATILAVFFAGLALGSYLISRILTSPSTDSTGSLQASSGQVKRIRTNPLILYGLLELGIGIYALLSPVIFELIKLLQVGFWKVFTPSFGSFNFFTFILSVMALIIPTTLMGATYPAIVAAAGKNRAGILYGINTAGAVLGVILPGFFLISFIGVNQTIWLASLVNIAISITALILSKKFNLVILASDEGARPESNNDSGVPRLNRRGPQNDRVIPGNDLRTVLLISFIFSGLAAIGLEVLFTRMLILSIGGSIYAFSIVLTVFLLGIALGSGLSAKIFSRSQNTLLWYCVLQFLLGIIIILTLPLLGNLPLTFLSVFQKFGSSFGSLQFGLFLLSAMIIFLPTVLMGMIFPVFIKAYASNIRDLGVLYGANTVGGVVGSLAAGFLLIPLIGTARSILVMAFIYLIVGAGLVYKTKIKNLFRYSFTLALIILLFVGLKFANWNNYLITSGLFVEPDEFRGMDNQEILKKVKKSPILFQKEGISALITVKKDMDGNINMQINGKTDASTGSDMENQVLLGQLPLLLHPNPKEVLVIGVGSGITLGSVLSHPVEKVDAVEIEEKVVEAAKYFAEYNSNALNDRRVKLIIADGRNYLLASNKKYDVVSSEPSNPWLSGSSKLFTKEYFQQLKNAAKQDGIVLHWVNMYAIGIKGLQSVIKAYLEVFPEVAAYGVPISNDLLLLGSNKAIKISSEILETKLKDEKVIRDLKKASIEKPFEILARFYLDKKALKKIARGAPTNTDNFPYLEFQAPKKLYYEASENPWRIISQDLAPISNVTVSTGDQVLEKADKLRRARILARVYFVERNIGEAIKYAQMALDLDPVNPYLKENSARLYFEQGTAYFNSKDYPKAAASYEKSLDLKETPEAYFNLGQSYEDTEPEKAKEAFEKAILLDPNFTEALERLGRLYVEEGNLNEALDTFLKLDKLEPNSINTVLNLAQLYFLRQDFGNAAKFAQKALKLDPRNEDAKEILEKLP